MENHITQQDYSSYGASERTNESSISAVSWAAILAGAAATAAVSLLMVALGAGIGLTSFSVWGNHDSSAAFTAKAAIWFIVMQWASASIGGYLAGQLRTKWTGLHTDEVFFRDTAHGFLTWALATVVTASFLASAAASLVSGGVTAVSHVAAAGASQASQMSSNSDSNAYFVDTMFRSNQTVTDGVTNVDSSRYQAESLRILANGIKNGDVSQQDRAYLAQLVANQTGMSQPEAQKRVDDAIAQVKEAEVKAKQAAENARKASAHASFFTFFSLLIGAFIACVSAALGGKLRDQHV